MTHSEQFTAAQSEIRSEGKRGFQVPKLNHHASAAQLMRAAPAAASSFSISGKNCSRSRLPRTSSHMHMAGLGDGRAKRGGLGKLIAFDDRDAIEMISQNVPRRATQRRLPR